PRGGARRRGGAAARRTRRACAAASARRAARAASPDLRRTGPSPYLSALWRPAPAGSYLTPAAARSSALLAYCLSSFTDASRQAHSALLNSSGHSFLQASLMSLPLAGYLMCSAACFFTRSTSEKVHCPGFISASAIEQVAVKARASSD